MGSIFLERDRGALFKTVQAVLEERLTELDRELKKTTENYLVQANVTGRFR